ncbi:DNA-binding transcriptional regulator, LysR family [Amycolatopsis xylanica]|uniref:DNA-binding transcriptional regulator, LysR family n=1 Tax=Amycolatopsis xylanica TaxID=589385 RepID=A0A1H2TEA7_9PSEU|nr:LysR family transcriptional regulator [Amycolatopsis xylanica]SDW42202.1 DNA-binding transcriptional regulator, LysR family [Amycolatopsis xylanica]
MLNPIHLRTLRECVRTGSFAEAARGLGYTASAVSQQMMLLERAVGAALFERSARSVRPTAVAQLLAERSQDVLGALAKLESEARAMALGEHGTLRLASFATASARVLPPALAEIVARCPGAEVELDEGEPDEVLGGVVDGAVDLALVFEYDLDPREWPISLHRTELLAEPLTIAVPSAHAAEGPEVELAELADEPWMCTREDTAGARSLGRLAHAAGFTPRIIFRSNDYTVLRDLVARGLGVAMLPGLAVSGEGIRALRPAGVTASRRVLAVHRPHNGNPLLPVALDCLRIAASTLLLV